jgi:hypothetical protein
MSSKTYKRKNTKSKNKKKDIKTLKKINIKRNNRRDKIRSNIRKIRGGGDVSINWNFITGFLNGINFDNVDPEDLIEKEIKFQIQDEATIIGINASITAQDKKFTQETIITGKIIIINIQPTYLFLVIEFKLGIRKYPFNRKEPFYVCINNNKCINKLSMFEIKGIEGKTIQKTQSHAGPPNMFLTKVNHNNQPNNTNNNFGFKNNEGYDYDSDSDSDSVKNE